MAGFNGGFLGGNYLPTASQKQPGVWSLQEAYRGRTENEWPSTVVGALATGGTDVYEIVVGGITYAVHQYTNVGTFDFVLSTEKDIEYLVVGGGGGGGGLAEDPNGGGGGAGGFLTGTISGLAAGTYSVVVGNGGSAATNGQDSQFDTIIATGGGRGGSGSSGISGGSGGGAGSASGVATISGGSAIAGQGYGGGSASGSSVTYGISTQGCGGGGGAGGSGLTGNKYYTYSGQMPPYTVGGQGGPGTTSSISGSTRYYAAGGGGGYQVYLRTYGYEALINGQGDFNQNGGLGGLGGGGNAALFSYVFAGDRREATSGQVNTGSGGGGGGGSGGSGIVIVRYVIS